MPCPPPPARLPACVPAGKSSADPTFGKRKVGGSPNGPLMSNFIFFQASEWPAGCLMSPGPRGACPGTHTPVTATVCRARTRWAGCAASGGLPSRRLVLRRQPVVWHRPPGVSVHALNPVMHLPTCRCAVARTLGGTPSPWATAPSSNSAAVLAAAWGRSEGQRLLSCMLPVLSVLSHAAVSQGHAAYPTAVLGPRLSNILLPRHA